MALTCVETCFVNSNMVTCFLPPKITLRVSSALMRVFFFSSWSLFFLIYSQIFLVISLRGMGFEPTTAARASSGWTGFMKAALGLRVAGFLVGIGDCFYASPSGDARLFFYGFSNKIAEFIKFGIPGGPAFSQNGLDGR